MNGKVRDASDSCLAESLAEESGTRNPIIGTDTCRSVELRRVYSGHM